MKKYSSLLALTALSLSNDFMMDNFDKVERVSYEPKPILPPKPKGKLFVIDGVEIYALNEKNAIRKFNNLVN